MPIMFDSLECDGASLPLRNISVEENKIFLPKKKEEIRDTYKDERETVQERYQWHLKKITTL